MTMVTPILFLLRLTVANDFGDLDFEDLECPLGWSEGNICGELNVGSVCCVTSNSDEASARRECESWGTDESDHFAQFTLADEFTCEIQRQRYCDIEEGIAYSGTVLYNIPNVFSAGHCSEICGTTQGCRSWVYNDDQAAGDSFRLCSLLKEVRPGRQQVPGLKAGLPCIQHESGGCPQRWHRGGDQCFAKSRCCSVKKTEDYNFDMAREDCEVTLSAFALEGPAAPGGIFIAPEDDPYYYCQLDLVETPKIEGCELELQTEFVGNDFMHIDRVRSIVDCSLICASTSECRSWSYIKDFDASDFHTCYLKRVERGNLVRREHVESGLPCTIYRGTGEDSVQLFTRTPLGQVTVEGVELSQLLSSALSTNLVVEFNNADIASPADRVAIYHSSEVGGRLTPPRPLIWVYTCGSQACTNRVPRGSIEFGPNTPLPAGILSWPLPPGTYRVCLIREGDGIVATSEEINIVATAELASDALAIGDPVAALNLGLASVADPIGITVSNLRGFGNSRRRQSVGTPTATRVCEAIQDAKHEPKDNIPNQGRTVEPNFQACRLRCVRTIGCAHFSFYPDGSCHLSDATGTIVPELGTVTGSDTCVCQFLRDTAYFPMDQIPDAGRTTVADAEACRQRCIQTAGCVHFNFSPSDGGCNLGDASATRRAQSGVVTGSALCVPATRVVPDVVYRGCRQNRNAQRVNGHIRNVNQAQCINLARTHPAVLFGLEFPEGFSTAGRAECLILTSPSQYENMQEIGNADCETEGLSFGHRLGGANALAVYERIPECTADTATHTLANNQYNPKCCGTAHTPCDDFSCGRVECAQPVYQGCFVNNGNARISTHERRGVFESAGYTFGHCQDVMYSRGRTIMGMEFPQGFEIAGEAECLILDSAAQYLAMTKVADSECAAEGLFGGRRQGGPNRLAVYTFPAPLDLSGVPLPPSARICEADRAETHWLLDGSYNNDCCGKRATICDGCGCGRTECCSENFFTDPNTGNCATCPDTPPECAPGCQNCVIEPRLDCTQCAIATCLQGPVTMGDFPTCGGTAAAQNQAGLRCQFPFAFGGVSYNSCTRESNGHNQGQLWCYTGVADPSNPGRNLWGSCECGGASTPIRGISYATAPRAGLACQRLGLDGITSRQQCRNACTGLLSSFEVVNRSIDPGCSYKVTAPNVGSCQWNSNYMAASFDVTRRNVCLDSRASFAQAGDDRSNGLVVPAPEAVRCTEVRLARVSTEYDCQVACTLIGEGANFNSGAWDRPAGCWIKPGRSCTWNNRQDGRAEAPDNFRELCNRGTRHFENQCLKSDGTTNCCGQVGQITCKLGFQLAAPLTGETCDPSICEQDFCDANPTAGAYRCVIPEYGWQPPSAGQASCGATRTYHGKVGLAECVRLCELDPLCYSIFGALEEGDNSCWTCPETRLRPATQLNDGEDPSSTIATTYKAYRLKRRTKYAFGGIPGSPSCPEGFVDLSFEECNALSAAIISNSVRTAAQDNSKAGGCRIPLNPADADAATPNFSTGSHAVEETSKIVCKLELPNDALVSRTSSDFSNAFVSGEVADDTGDISVRSGQNCIDGKVTTYCSSALSSSVERPFLEFDINEPMVVMRLYIAARGDDRTTDLGRFTVKVFDGRAWQLCYFRAEVDPVEQYSEVYCDHAGYAEKVRIELGKGNRNHLQIADVVVQGISPEQAIVADPEYIEYKNHGACIRHAPAAQITSKPCTRNTKQACEAEGRAECNKMITCFGYELDIRSPPARIITYDQRAVDENERGCDGDDGLTRSRSELHFYRKRTKVVFDVICFERPCWSYEYSTGTFKTSGCTDPQLQVATALVDELEQTRKCNLEQGVNREACFRELQFRRFVGEGRYAVFERQKALTAGNTCQGEFLRRRKAKQDSTSPKNFLDTMSTRRRLLSRDNSGRLQREGASDQCRRRAQVTNTAACAALQDAASRTVELYQDQVSLAERRVELLDRQALVDGITAGLDMVAGASGIGSNGLKGGIGKPKTGGKSALRAQQAGIAILTSGTAIGGAFGLITAPNNALGEAGFAREEIRLLQREANIAQMRDMSDIAATCDARSTDDLLCQQTELRERVDENFYNVLRVAQTQHINVMDALAAQDQVLNSNHATAESIRIIVEQTLRTVSQNLELQREFSAVLRDIEYLRARYATYSGPNGAANFADFAQRNQDWCEMIRRFADDDLYERIVRFVEADVYRDLYDPNTPRHPNERGVYTRCEVDQFRREYTDGHRSIVDLFNFANGIREYTAGFKPDANREADVRDNRQKLANAYMKHLNHIESIPTGAAIRCVGEAFECPPGFHKTHVNPDPQARVEYTMLSEPVTVLPCAPDTCTCPNGRAATTECTGHQDAVCESCNFGYILDNGTCRKIRPTCEKGLPENDAIKLRETDDAMPFCNACEPGYHLEEKSTPVRGEFKTCEINVCYCKHGQGLMGADCNEHFTAGNAVNSIGVEDEQCGSCNAGRTLVRYTSSCGPRIVCEREVDGARFFENFHFAGKRSIMPERSLRTRDIVTEIWGEYQPTGSIVVYPGHCIGLRATNGNWQRFANRALSLYGEQYMCNCHPDQVSINEAYGFNHVTLGFQGLRRFKCDDSFLDFMTPEDTPGKVWHRGNTNVAGANDIPAREGPVDASVGGEDPPLEIREHARYDSHRNSRTRSWFTGNNDIVNS